MLVLRCSSGPSVRLGYSGLKVPPTDFIASLRRRDDLDYPHVLGQSPLMIGRRLAGPLLALLSAVRTQAQGDDVARTGVFVRQLLQVPELNLSRPAAFRDPPL